MLPVLWHYNRQAHNIKIKIKNKMLKKNYISEMYLCFEILRIKT
jgi:hypothetical protein